MGREKPIDGRNIYWIHNHFNSLCIIYLYSFICTYFFPWKTHSFPEKFLISFKWFLKYTNKQKRLEKFTKVVVDYKKYKLYLKTWFGFITLSFCWFRHVYSFNLQRFLDIFFVGIGPWLFSLAWIYFFHLRVIKGWSVSFIFRGNICCWVVLVFFSNKELTSGWAKILISIAVSSKGFLSMRILTLLFDWMLFSNSLLKD